MSLRILFAIHGPADPLTAVYSNVSQVRATLESEGHAVELLTAEDLRAGWLPARLDPLVLPISLLRRRLRSYDAVVFHSYLGWAFHALARPRRRGARPATITAFHGLEPLYHRTVADEARRAGGRVSARFRLLHHVLLPKLLRFSTSRSDGVFCLNRAEAAYLADHRWASSDRIHVLPNGFDPGVAVVERGYASSRRFLCLAQWLPAKGVRYLVDAFTRVAALRPEVILTCAGTGASETAVLAAFPETVRARVRVLPQVTRDEVRRELRESDVFVFPTLSEGFSLALLEALAARLPVVCTAAGAATDILRDGVHALIVPPADAGALAAAMERLAGDDELRRRLGEGTEGVAARFCPARVGRQYSDRIVEIVSAHAAH